VYDLRTVAARSRQRRGLDVSTVEINPKDQADHDEQLTVAVVAFVQHTSARSDSAMQWRHASASSSLLTSPPGGDTLK
jgi:hypothetical protein